MKLREGRIGKQEGVCILCIIIVLMSVFTLNSKTAYDRGNTSYIWLPAGILLAVAGAGLSLFCMERSGKEELCGFYFFGLGGIKCPPLSRHEFLIDPNTCSSHYAAICLAR